MSLLDYLQVADGGKLLLLGAILWPIVLGIYRVWLHPLSHIPGPKLAACTWWYEYYFDCVLKGQYIWEIDRLHRVYGPIIRINPFEVHISDPDYFGEIYSQNKKRDVWAWAKKGYGIDVSTLTTIHHDHHRRRRAALNPLFSKQRIVKLQPVIQERLDCLLHRIHDASISGTELNLKLGCAAFTADVAMEYFFGKHQDKLAVEDFDGAFHDAINAGFNNMPFLNHWPWIMSGMRSMAARAPGWLLAKFARGKMTSFIAAQKQIAIQVREALAKKQHIEEDASGYNMYDTLLASRLPLEEKTFTRLVQEGGLMVGAATVSTAWAMTVTLYCLVANPGCLKKLKEELSEAYPAGAHQIGDLSILEHLPYLQACIQEGIRMSIGASHRSQRLSHEPMVFTDKTTHKSYALPAGTPLSMTHVLLFQDETIFPEHNVFKPERWIDTPGLERYQFAFSKGTRACIGINLAMCELELFIAHLFRRYGSSEYSTENDIGVIEPFETDWTDLECVGDGGVPLQKADSKGVRFKIRPNHEASQTASDSATRLMNDAKLTQSISPNKHFGEHLNAQVQSTDNYLSQRTEKKAEKDLARYRNELATKLRSLDGEMLPSVAVVAAAAN